MSILRGKAAAAVVAGFVSTHGHTAISVDAYRDLAASEALVTTPYYDVAGVLTVCIGETKGVEMREYTPDECSAMLVKRVEGYFVPAIRRCTRRDVWDSLHQETIDALVETSYNIGVGAYCRSSIRKRLDAGRGAAACDRILLYNKATVNGALKPIEGLTKRRQREADKCRRGFESIKKT